METGIRFVAEHYSIKTGEVIKTTLIKDEVLTKATTLKELGFLHTEQIEIIKTIQDIKICSQILLNATSSCPICSSLTHKRGLFPSEFHSALTDHTVMVQRMICRKCGWHSPISVEGIFGSKLHPDLLKKQALQGSKESFEKAATSLDAESASTRKINNHSQIMRAVKRVGNSLETLRSSAEPTACSPELIAHIDGGHIKSRGEGRSFEGMIATVYCPESLVPINENRNQIVNKTAVASVKDDSHSTMKKLFIAACKTQGMSIQSTIVCLADGADNCRDIAYSIKEYCKEIVYILDWFHIGKRFQNISILPEHKEEFERIKFTLWHGNVDKALKKLDEFMQIESISKHTTTSERLAKLSGYISNNRLGIINYAARKKAGLVFTSNLAECTVNTLINERQKGKQKMLWSREGAHNILQVRASVFSKSWDSDWAQIEAELYPLAA